MFNVDDDPKPVQIIATSGWRVLYAEDDGTGYYSDLVGWVLLDNGDIEPVDADHSGYIGWLCRETQNFVGLFGPSEIHTPEDTKRLVSEWREKQERLKRRA